MKREYQKPPTLSTVKAPVHPLFVTEKDISKDKKKSSKKSEN